MKPILDIQEKDDGFWLIINGPKSAAIHLGHHGPIVNRAIREAHAKLNSEREGLA